MKHKKNYFMFNPEEEEPRELTADEKEKMLKLFRNPGHQAEAREIVKLWMVENYIIQFDIFDYIDNFSYSNKQKQLIFNMYLFLREYTAEIMNNKEPDGMDELEELLFSIFEKGATDFYEELEKDRRKQKPTRKELLKKNATLNKYIKETEDYNEEEIEKEITEVYEDKEK